ncbi:MAG TPA: histidine phosphatase family protein [Candidatus Binataceae bacterium]|nr:histidine phosphatase family protein [Candidatus Binataceae bacterium]
MVARARLVIVRHGETVGHSSIRYYGRTDVALSDLGRRQMRAARAWLSAQEGTMPFAAVFASPLVRATEAARIIAGHGTHVVEIGDLAEVDFGLFEGLTAEEIAERYPEEYRRWNTNRLAPEMVYPEGESRAAFVERVARGAERMLAAWQDLRARGRSDTAALMVAHRGVIRAVVRRLTGIVEPRIDLGSIHILEEQPPCGADLRGARWRAVALDLTAHLF